MPPENSAKLARLYTPDEFGRLRYAEDLNPDLSAPPRSQSAIDGLVSTPTDYARFCKMLLNGGSLANEGILGAKRSN